MCLLLFFLLITHLLTVAFFGSELQVLNWMHWIILLLLSLRTGTELKLFHSLTGLAEHQQVLIFRLKLNSMFHSWETLIFKEKILLSFDRDYLKCKFYFHVLRFLRRPHWGQSWTVFFIKWYKYLFWEFYRQANWLLLIGMFYLKLNILILPLSLWAEYEVGGEKQVILV